MLDTPLDDAFHLLSWQFAMGIEDGVLDEPQDHTLKRAEAALPAPASRPLLQQSSASRSPDQPAAAPRAVPPSAARPAGELVAGARQTAAACTTLDELRQAFEALEGCPLKATAMSFVFADGVAGADLMVIGEAPGRDEDRSGLPFVGRSGQLLDRMLQAIGRSRTENVYIANILPWRPPGDRTPTAAEIALCLPFIQRHIELAKPKVVALLGSTSAKSLLDSAEGITRLRGRWRDLQCGTLTVPTMPSFHPAYLLRSPAQKRLAWRDFLSVADKLRNMG